LAVRFCGHLAANCCAASKGAEARLALGFVANLLSVLFATGLLVAQHYGRTTCFLNCWSFVIALCVTAAVSSDPLMTGAAERKASFVGFVIWCRSFGVLFWGLLLEPIENNTVKPDAE